MRILFIILISLVFSISLFSQPISNRSSDVITVQDGNLFAKNSFRPAPFADTLSANNSVTTLDSCGKLIFTYSDNSYWLRACSPKRWVRLLKEGEAENISNAALTADGNYAQNWNNKQLRIDSIAGSLFFRGGGIGNTGTVRKEFSISWPGSAFANQLDAYSILTAIRKSDNSADSLRLGLLSGGTGVLSMGSYDVANSANNTFISYSSTAGLININAKDSIWIKGAVPAATADSILAVVYRSSPGISKIVKIPLTATGLNNTNLGSDFRWLNEGTQEVKTVANSNTIAWDSTSTANSLTAKADTSVLATQYDLTQLATPSWQQTLDVSNTHTTTLIYDTTMVGNPVEKLWHKYEPLVKTDTATTAFYDWQFSGLNNGSFNEVRMFGWNLNAGGGQMIAGKPALGEAWESNFRTEPSPGVFHRYVEKHEIYVTPANVQHRIGSYTIDTDAETISLYHTVGSFSLHNIATHTPYYTILGSSNNTQSSWINSVDQTAYFGLNADFNQDANTSSLTFTNVTPKLTSLFNLSNFTTASFPDVNITGKGYDGAEIRFNGATDGLLGRLQFDSSKTNLSNFTNVPIHMVVDGITDLAVYKTKVQTGVPITINNGNLASVPFAALESIASAASLEAAGWFQQSGTSGTRYGIEVTANGASGTNEALYLNASNATNNRAIRIQFPVAGASNYAIYSDATAKSYHRGQLGIGSGVTTPDSTLHINGSFHNNAGVRMEGLPVGPGTRAVRINASGTLSVADTSAGGITTLNTLTTATQTFAVGTSGTDFNISSVTDVHTFNIPDASASNRGLVTTGTQTLTGEKTFSLGVVANNAGQAAGVVISGNRSVASAPGVGGIGLSISAFTYTNTSGAGTEAGNHNINMVNAPTLTSSSAIDYTGDVATIRFAGAPIAAGSSTIAKPYNIFANDNSYFQGLAGGLNETASDITLGAGLIQHYTGTGGTWTLPTLANAPGRIYMVKNMGSGNLTVQRGGSDNIFDAASVTSVVLAVGDARMFIGGGSFWAVH